MKINENWQNIIELYRYNSIKPRLMSQLSTIEIPVFWGQKSWSKFSVVKIENQFAWTFFSFHDISGSMKNVSNVQA